MTLKNYNPGQQSLSFHGNVNCPRIYCTCADGHRCEREVNGHQPPFEGHHEIVINCMLEDVSCQVDHCMLVQNPEFWIFRVDEVANLSIAFNDLQKDTAARPHL